MSARLVGFPRLADGQKSVLIEGISYRARDFRDSEEPSFCVTSKARSWTVFDHGTRAGGLSSSQIGALQGFRTDYPWHGSRTAQVEQIANAVPPPMGAALLHFLTN